ncbi:MAG: PBP1A family penicillin-binding protein, partial [Deltaproteobacteria bacterium]|nr:PBP1A family penicillin-binding protein [Deltaproteobacteria bacterium]
SDLPKIQTVKDYKPTTTTEFYDRNGELLLRLYNQKRTVTDAERLPKHVINAFLAAEVADFFRHKGVDITTILRALVVNLTSGRLKQGGSTITQQVVKTFFLNPERTLSRKIKEAILSYRLEKNLTKMEILHLYLNQIYFGAGNYGIFEASKYFFNKNPSELTIEESAFLASLVKAPEPFATFRNPRRVRDRQLYIIRQMEKNGFITAEEAKKSINSPLSFAAFTEKTEMSYSLSYALRQIKEEIDPSKLYNGGWGINLTIDKKTDEALNRELTLYLNELNAERFSPLASLNKEEFYQTEKLMRNRISEFRKYYQNISEIFGSENYFSNKKIGFRITKPFQEGTPVPDYIEKNTKLSEITEGDIFLGIITDSDKKSIRILTGESVEEIPLPKKNKEKDSSFRTGDICFYIVTSDNKLSIANPPLIQGAVVLIENKSGEILGMSGGYSYTINEFNRAVQAKRQPGSAFKPLLYAYAIESGKYNIISVENDAPVEYTDPQTGQIYRPLNYDKDEFRGEMTLIDAITESKNTVSVRLLLSLGLENVASFINGLGLDIEVKPYPSMALGAFETTLLSLSQFYSSLANGGTLKKPQIILSIKDENGLLLFEKETEERQVIMSETAFIITRMLKDVVSRGTGTAANTEGLNIAGKTGTTNNYTNAWFIGYTPRITMGILIGRDDNKSMGRKATGGYFAAPLFKRILKNPALSELTTAEDFNPPNTIKFILTDIHTGKRCEEESEDCRFLPFREGTEPPENMPEVEKDIMRIEH